MNFSTNHNATKSVESGRVGIGLWLALFGAPSAWVAQLLLSEPFSAYACYPHQEPLAEPVLRQLMWILGGISATCLLLALLSGAAAWLSWRQLVLISKPGRDRNRFLAKLGLLASFIFIVAIIFNIFAVLWVPPCTPWR